MKYLIPALLCCMAITACKKNTYKTTGTTPKDAAMQYAINGIMSYNTKWTDSIKTSLVLLHMGGKQEALTLSVEGLPANATAVLSQPSGTPPFNTTFNIYTQNVAGGSYGITVVATTASGIKKNHNFTLNVKGDSVFTICQDAMVGTYSNTDSSGITNTTTSITATGKNKIHLTDLFPNLGTKEEFDGWIDCDKKMVHIITKPLDPQPSYSFMSIGGSGEFTKDSIVLTLVRTEYDSGSPQVDYYYYKRTLVRK